MGGLLLRVIDVDELTTIFWRSLFALVGLSLYLFWRYGTGIVRVFTAFRWPHFLVAGCFAVDAMLYVFAINRTSVANVMVIFGLTPFVAALLAWVVLRERVGAATWLAMLVCAIGITVMMMGSIQGHAIFGDLLAIVIIFIFAVGVVTIRKYPDIEMIPVVWLSALMSVILFLPLATPFGHGVEDYVFLAFFGIFEYALALIAFTVGASYIPAAQSTLIGLLENVLAPVWVWLVVHEVPETMTLVGGILILATLLLHIGWSVRNAK